MHERDATRPTAPADAQRLEQEVRVLRERLAFYEGFDGLIQDNVAHARELFRLAAQEREAASAEIERAKREAAGRQAHVEAELRIIQQEVEQLGRAVEALSRRISSAVGEADRVDDGDPPTATSGARSFAVIAHGVSSPNRAMSLQRFVAALPQVTGVSAREFAGGVLRLDARVRGPLLVEQFREWEPRRPIALLTERPDVVEFAVGGSG